MRPFSRHRLKGTVFSRIAMTLSHKRSPATSIHLCSLPLLPVTAETRIHPRRRRKLFGTIQPGFTSFESRMARSPDDHRGAQRVDSRARDCFVFFYLPYDSPTVF
ncbi:hypothetical protein ACGC1H_006705 [Rhizoctonia solani]